MTVNKAAQSAAGLGNRALLDKMDKLREIGISGMVPLPQLVVVGDQSTGKSSVLESLTGFQMPKAATLCTRHATEIICRREEQESIVISIHAIDSDKAKTDSFRREVTDLEGLEFNKIFQDAAKAMGIKDDSEGGGVGSAFSRDVLRVEISGPNEDHLTLIDVPGMFENETPGVTTKDDIELVKNMVKDYIKESRTIILAVVPCTGDIATQKILNYAKEVDPEGKRTLGVLTKPDLAIENATRNVIVDLVRGKRQDLQLGYCLVKNRGADDTSSSAEERNQQERTFFAQAPWTSLPSDRLGIPALKVRIQQLLMDRTKSEFPKVRSELSSKLKEKRVLLKDMGEARSTTDQQRVYIGKVASEFNQIKNFGLDAYYNRHGIFDNADLKLITRIRELNELFSKVLYAKGHTRVFAAATEEIDEDAASEQDDSNASDAGDTTDALDATDDFDRDDLYDGEARFKIPSSGDDDLDGILSDAYHCPNPSPEDILEYIEREYMTSRGYELGTFSSEMLPTTFKEQSKKWPMMARAHVSNAILVVHHFIRTALDSVCPDSNVRAELWPFLLEDLQQKYQRAMNHAEFLLEVEFQSKSITYNPAFETKLSKFKAGPAEQLKLETDKLLEHDTMSYGNWNRLVSSLRSNLSTVLGTKNTIETTKTGIHDVLRSFYDISRSRFVDVLCQQVIDHFLLFSNNGPLTILSDSVILKMTPEQLENIAGEDMLSRERREKLAQDIDGLTKALKILKA